LPTSTWPGIEVPGRVPLDLSTSGIECGIETRNQAVCGSLYITGIYIALRCVFINKGARPLSSKGLAK